VTCSSTTNHDSVTQNKHQENRQNILLTETQRAIVKEQVDNLAAATVGSEDAAVETPHHAGRSTVSQSEAITSLTDVGIIAKRSTEKTGRAIHERIIERLRCAGRRLQVLSVGTNVRRTRRRSLTAGTTVRRKKSSLGTTIRSNRRLDHTAPTAAMTFLTTSRGRTVRDTMVRRNPWRRSLGTTARRIRRKRTAGTTTDAVRRMRRGTSMTQEKREQVLVRVNNLRRNVQPTASNMIFMVRPFIRRLTCRLHHHLQHRYMDTPQL